jgi:glycosyltransferase involved in cell wall biosynthesis
LTELATAQRTNRTAATLSVPASQPLDPSVPATSAVDRIRILHAITDLDVGGAETQLWRLLSAAGRQQFVPAVLSLMAPGLIGARLEALGIAVMTLNMPRRLPSLVTSAKLLRAARRVRPDLLQGWMYHGNLAATVAGLVAGRPRRVLWNVRHSIHDLAREKPPTRALVRIGAALSGLPRAIIYNSRVSAAQHERLGYAGDKTVVIPNGFDCEQFKPCAAARGKLCDELGIDPARTIVGMVARMHPMKDPVNAIRAVGLARNAALDLHLIMVGEDFVVTNRVLTDAIRAAGVADRVSLLGERQDVSTMIPGFDIKVLPSAWGEGFPNVLGEAMACGVPCVATDVGDCAWIVGDAGLIVPPRDPAALAGALRRLVELGPEGRHRLGATGRARALEHFSIQEMVRQYEALYERIARDVRAGR